jgi:hypothetical protein
MADKCSPEMRVRYPPAKKTASKQMVDKCFSRTEKVSTSNGRRDRDSGIHLRSGKQVFGG